MFFINFNRYNQDLERKIACKKCRIIKTNETIQNTYGVNSVSQIIEIKNKIKQTCQNKYGCDNPMQNNVMKERFKEIIFNKYGVYNVMHDENIKSKINKYII